MFNATENLVTGHLPWVVADLSFKYVFFSKLPKTHTNPPFPPPPPTHTPF